MKNIVYTITIIFSLLSKTIAQNDTLWHIGGRSDHGIPFGYHFSDFSFIEYKSTEDDYWEIDTVKTLFRVFINAESYNGNIYIFGGNGYGEYPDEMEIFNTSSKSISFGSPLAYPRKSSGLTSPEHSSQAILELKLIVSDLIHYSFCKHFL